jgi:tRNA1Val (adenine37-N6)-methyltransferase
MSTFHFKQFAVQNEKSAMKVNTDSVLLGAWASINSNAETGLDIGSGTGILSLMIAQRYPKMKIIGLEIEKQAFEESKINFTNSKWKRRLQAVNLPLQEYVPNSKLDCIISNPPYYINNLKNQNISKSQARHTDTLSFEELINFAETFLSEKGTFNLILPKTEGEIFINIASESRLNFQKITFIKPNKNKSINRVMMCFGKEEKDLLKGMFCVYKSKGVYSKEHHQLTKDFYLDKI